MRSVDGVFNSLDIINNLKKCCRLSGYLVYQHQHKEERQLQRRYAFRTYFQVNLAKCRKYLIINPQPVCLSVRPYMSFRYISKLAEYQLLLGALVLTLRLHNPSTQSILELKHQSCRLGVAGSEDDLPPYPPFWFPPLPPWSSSIHLCPKPAGSGARNLDIKFRINQFSFFIIRLQWNIQA